MPKKDTEKMTQQILVRVPPSMVTAIDEWRRGQFDLPTRAEALRRLAASALKSETKVETEKKGRKP